MIDVRRLAGWMDDQGLPGRGEPIEHRLLSGGMQNLIYEISRGELHCAMRIPPPSAPADRDAGVLREWRIIEALTGTDVPVPRGRRPVRRRRGRGPALLPDGFRRRLVARGSARVARPLRRRSRGQAGTCLPDGRGHRAAVQGRLGGEGPARPGTARRLPRAPGGPVDHLP